MNVMTVKGFRRRMLAVRPVEGVPSTKLFRLHLFWMFTLIGLTVPYRIWFATHCDELRVTVAKETASGKTGSSSWSWFSKSTSKQATEWNNEFKSKMRELALYARGERLALIESSNETKAEQPIPPMEEEVLSDVDAIKSNETSADAPTMETNATETKTDSDEGKKEDQPEPPPPPPPSTDGEEMAVEGDGSNNKHDSDESPSIDKEQ